MISFKKLLLSERSLNPQEYIFEYKGKYVIRSNHRRDRYNERNTANQSTKFVFKKAIEWLIKNGKSRKQYLFVSKSTYLGFAVDYRPDTRKKVQGDQLILITWFGKIDEDLPVPKTPETLYSKFKSDIKVILEQYNIEETIELD